MSDTFLRPSFFGKGHGMTFADGGGLTWAFDPTTNKLSATVSTTTVTSANPTAKVGPAAVNGTAGTFMTSDSAPPIDLTAAFSWSGLHTFSKIVTIGAPASGNSLTVNGVAAGIPINLVTPAAGNYPLQFTDGTHIGGFFTSGTAGVEVQFGSISNHGVAIFTNNGAPVIQFSAAGDTKINGKSGFNGTTPITKPTVTGSKGANAALTSLLTALAAYGLVIDSSTV